MQKDLECSRNPLNNLGAIPGNLAIASATQNPEKSKNIWIPAFTGMTGGASLIYFAHLGSRTLADRRHYKA
jgi:hypothetical protein